ncbi:MAG: DUF1223 domain-containing protein [Candidatus Hydrogenedentes bacterium]|nr:DUF1223 domain-containing protein [Candidatus Hydrogenedentota bacterium]
MRSIQKILSFAVILGAVVLVSCHAAAQSDAARARSGVLVELFTSQGCASCPPADRFLSELKDRDGIVAMAWHVDYWDKNGWTDSFSDHAFSERQISYARKFENDRVYTPQMIIDGRAEFNGNDNDRVRAAIENADTRRKATLRLDAEYSGENRDLLLTTIRLHRIPPANSEQTCRVVLAITEDNLKISIARGENRGITLMHDAVVRWARVVGEVHGGAFEESIHVPIDPAWKRDNLRLVAFAQQGSTRYVLAAASIPLNRVFDGQERAP